MSRRSNLALQEVLDCLAAFGVSFFFHPGSGNANFSAAPIARIGIFASVLVNANGSLRGHR